MYSDQSFEYEVKLITSNMVVQGSWVVQMLKNLTLRNQFNFKLYLKKTKPGNNIHFKAWTPGGLTSDSSCKFQCGLCNNSIILITKFSYPLEELHHSQWIDLLYFVNCSCASTILVIKVLFSYSFKGHEIHYHWHDL